jgi:hypothetical protein
MSIDLKYLFSHFDVDGVGPAERHSSDMLWDKFWEIVDKSSQNIQ